MPFLVIMGSPSRNMNTVMPRVNFFLCGCSVLGQLSTSPVMRLSTPQNWESMPRVSSMMKKRKAQSGEGAMVSTTSGYTRKASPGPDLTTSPTSTPLECAM